MAKIYISDIRPNQEIESSFVVTEKQLRVARNGSPFLTLKLADKTGEVTGRIWERAGEVADLIPVKGVVSVRCRSESFRDELQLQIQSISPLPLEEVDPADFLPVCPVSVKLLFDRLRKIAASVRRPCMQELMRQLLADRPLMERFKRAPAAKSMHHAYLGGLLEHTVSVAELVSELCRHYRDLDRDLLIAGAILHDIGKVHEFQYDLYIDYSHSGRLLGHMVLGLQILEDAIGRLKSFPSEEALLLKHLVLSHHGETQFGAVRLPMTREALVLHFADDLDAKMNGVSRILLESKGPDEFWTSYQPLFERFFYRGMPLSSEDDDESPVDAEQPQRDGVQLNFWAMDRKKKIDNP